MSPPTKFFKKHTKKLNDYLAELLKQRDTGRPAKEYEEHIHQAAQVLYKEIKNILGNGSIECEIWAYKAGGGILRMCFIGPMSPIRTSFLYSRYPKFDWENDALVERCELLVLDRLEVHPVPQPLSSPAEA